MLKMLILLVLLFINIFISNLTVLFDFFLDSILSFSFLLIIKLFTIIVNLFSSISSYLDIIDILLLILASSLIKLVFENSLTKVFLNKCKNQLYNLNFKIILWFFLKK